MKTKFYREENLPKDYIPIEKKLCVRKRYYVTLNGVRMTYSWFNWLPDSQGMGWKTKDECDEYKAKCIPCCPKKDKGKYSIEKAYYVCIGKDYAGSLHDFGQGPAKGSGRRKAGLRFPPSLSPQLGGFREKKKAFEAMRELQRYILDVKSVKAKYRAGSSRYW